MSLTHLPLVRGNSTTFTVTPKPRMDLSGYTPWAEIVGKPPGFDHEPILDSDRLSEGVITITLPRSLVDALPLGRRASLKVGLMASDVDAHASTLIPLSVSA